jgi:hypothetical protein
MGMVLFNIYIKVLYKDLGYVGITYTVGIEQMQVA